MIGFFIFLIGICIGSFMNVCIYRIPEEESLIPSSHCKVCDYKLKAKDLIPIVSYLLLKGRCRSCGKKFSIQYPLIELLNGILYSLLYIKYDFSIIFVKYSIIASILIVLALIDYNTQYVYSLVSWSGIIVSGIFVFIHFLNKENVSSFLVAAMVGVIIFGGINLFSKIMYKKQGLGGGDVEVILCMALTLGISNFILSFFLSVTLGSIICLLLLGLKKIKRGDYVPFVPFLALGTFITMFFGDEIIKIYMERILL
ncbi:prepilin peptidase [Oceanirhabdus sp. W0125-5]|uniref:prepilin peptidase n=1 Tax=Oceanirhabdus sp. W0125-5 TaxID=2999116 RepID=UPI0022F2DE0C|nr:A24 family peptidase [Oceanirhabdus sp. W0125-5]WBW99591.1 prepilin peptidase [Oceanirhabdus sp. W0125-5]